MNPWDIIGWFIVFWLLLFVVSTIVAVLVKFYENYVITTYRWFKTRNRAVENYQTWEGKNYKDSITIKAVFPTHYSVGTSTLSYGVKREDWSQFIRRNRLHLVEKKDK